MRNLKPYLKLNIRGIKDENGLYHDFSGFGNHGVGTGVTNPEGRDGMAMRFDGADDHVLVADNAAIQNICDGGGSVSCWLRVDSDGENNEGRILDKTGIALFLQSEASGKVEIKFLQDFSTSNGEWSSTVTEIPIKGYVFVALTYNNGNVANNPTIYVGGFVGVLTEDSTPVGTRTTDVGSDLYIGDTSGSDRCFDGDVEDLRFYNTELTAAEVLTLSKQTPRSLITTPSTKMRRYFDFDGSQDFLAHANDDAHNLGVADFALSVYMRTGASSAIQRLIGKYQTSNDRWVFRVDPTGKLRFYTKTTVTGNSAGVTSTEVFNDSKFHHVLLIADMSEATGLKLYGDGVECSYDSQQSPVAVGNIDNTGGLYVGGTAGGLPFSGQIVYARLLNFGKDGLPPGSDLLALIAGLKNNPGGTLTSYGLPQYEDANATTILNEGDFATSIKWTQSNSGGGTWSFAGAEATVSGDGFYHTLKQTAGNRALVGENSVYYEFEYEITANTLTGGVPGSRLQLISGAPPYYFSRYDHNMPETVGIHRISFLSSASAITKEFRIWLKQDATGGSISIDNLFIKRVGERGRWALDGTNAFRALDETVNALDLTQMDVTKQPSVIYDLGIKEQFEPLFFDPLSDQKLCNRWIVERGVFEPIYDSSVHEPCIKCTTSGVIGIPVPEQMQDLTKGNFEWTWDMYKGADANDTFCLFMASVIQNISDSKQNGYVLYFNADERIVFVERVAGAPSASSESAIDYISINQWYQCKVTRSAQGVFTFYINGTIVAVTSGTNPLTDITTTITKAWVFDIDAGDMIRNPKAVRY